MLALLENIGGAMKQRDNLSVRPGEPAVLSVPPRLNSFVVTAPDGSSQKIERDNAGQLVWTATDQPGLYRIAAADNALFHSMHLSLICFQPMNPPLVPRQR